MTLHRLFAPSQLRRSAESTAKSLKKTALYDLHVEAGAKMVPFAGWLMPVTYADQGIAQSCKHTRSACSLFDVSHMLQTRLHGPARVRFLESLVVADVKGLAIDESVLSVFTNAKGGIVDDTIINKQRDHLYIVSNAGCADKDLKHIRHQLQSFDDKENVEFEHVTNMSLIAVQGPTAHECLARLLRLSGDEAEADGILSSFAFMSTRTLRLGPEVGECHVSRSGYTGEDGFEIAVPNAKAEILARHLLGMDGVKWAGLGARDSLRLEAAMCLYGHDIDEDTTPVEAGLAWTIAKARRASGGFLGSDRILADLGKGVSGRRRVGLVLADGSAPARESAEVVATGNGESIGVVTSGGPSPTLGKNIAMAYVKAGYHKAGTAVTVMVRNKPQAATVVRMPFVPAKYFKL
eukprot:Partr_v1_DN26508_c1_g1_i1_m3588 putative The glycine cleavage system catalyzes the degradation of glycine (By similarity)